MSVKAPIGSTVRFTYDCDVGYDVDKGDAFVTASGRVYMVIAAARPVRGKHVATRWKVLALVALAAPAESRKHPLHWYPRGRRTPIGRDKA